MPRKYFGELPAPTADANVAFGTPAGTSEIYFAFFLIRPSFFCGYFRSMFFRWRGPGLVYVLDITAVNLYGGKPRTRRRGRGLKAAHVRGSPAQGWAGVRTACRPRPRSGMHGPSTRYGCAGGFVGHDGCLSHQARMISSHRSKDNCDVRDLLRPPGGGNVGTDRTRTEKQCFC